MFINERDASSTVPFEELVAVNLCIENLSTLGELACQQPLHHHLPSTSGGSPSKYR